MQNLIAIDELITFPLRACEAIRWPMCHAVFSSETSKAEHLETAHPGWAEIIMLAYLQKIPRENG
jgi:hypothetical protein